MWRTLIALAVLTPPLVAQAQPTAYDALKVVGTQFSRVAVGRVLSVTGIDGNPQPETWRITVTDRAAPSGVREIVVSNGRIVSSGPPSGSVVGTAAGAVIKTSRLNLDSSGAFSVANHTADQSHTNFALVSYTLRNNDRGFPEWIVTLQDERRRPVGTIHISANKGNVTRVAGLYHGANMAHVEQDPVRREGRRNEQMAEPEPEPGADDVEAAEDEDENVVKAEIKRMFRRTKRDAQELFERGERRFDKFFRR